MTTPEQARDGFDDWRARLATNAWDDHADALLELYGRGAERSVIHAFGAESSTALDTLIRENNRDENLPTLRRFDGVGRRTESIVFHPSYHELGRAVYRTGVMSRYAKPGQQFTTLALMYLYAQNGEGGHACPLACTAGMIRILQQAGGHEAWLERLLDSNYDTHFHASQFLTEVQGGSDVGANAVIARKDADGWRLYGEKWFCSVIDAHLFLVTARPEGEGSGTRGVKAFVVPRMVNGRVNDFHVRRLKYKLGTRSMASAEVDFVGAKAELVADFKDVVQLVLNTSRLYNAVASVGMLQRAYREAHAYAHTRMAFGQPIVAFPTVARIIARLRVESVANRSTTFFLADMADRIALGHATESEERAYRLLVNLNKFWTSVQGTHGIQDAIEVLGGNGAIESFSVLPRLLRDSIVCEAWEGGHNVLCAQALKDSARMGLHRDLRALLVARGAEGTLFDVAFDRWEGLTKAPAAQGALHVRTLAEELRVPVQSAVMRWEAAQPGGLPGLDLIIDDFERTNARGYDPLVDQDLGLRLTKLAD
jgi:acyl-CoA dehydrogenase